MGFLTRLLARLRAFQRIELTGANAGVQFSSRVEFRTEPSSKIKVSSGTLTVGYPLEDGKTFATADRTVITLGVNSTLRVEGDVIIAPGATIRIENGAEVTFSGRNVFAHNLTIICKKKICFAEGAEVSWNVTFIDDDGHTMENASGRAIRAFYKPMLIGANVGIQMNTLFPRGVTIGENSIIASGTTVRKDVPANCLAMSDANLKIKAGIRTTTKKIPGSREA